MLLRSLPLLSICIILLTVGCAVVYIDEFYGPDDGQASISSDGVGAGVQVPPTFSDNEELQWTYSRAQEQMVLFPKIDVNSDGELDQDEFATYLTFNGSPVAYEVDSNGDLRISEEELDTYGQSWGSPDDSELLTDFGPTNAFKWGRYVHDRGRFQLALDTFLWTWAFAPELDWKFNQSNRLLIASNIASIGCNQLYAFAVSQACSFEPAHEALLLLLADTQQRIESGSTDFQDGEDFVVLSETTASNLDEFLELEEIVDRYKEEGAVHPDVVLAMENAFDWISSRYLD